MTMKLGLRGIALAALVSSLLALVAGQASARSQGTASPGAACEPAPAGTKVNLKFTSWIPGAKKVVDLWNKQNPNIHVTYREVPSGQSGTYNNYINAIKSGRVDDLGFVEFEYLPTFRVQSGLEDIGACPGIKEAASMFVPWTWRQATFGEKGSVYGIPFDVAAMSYFYRKDLFDKNGLKPAKTWGEFLQLAEKVKLKGGRAVNVSPSAVGWFTGLVWQKGGQWFTNDGSAWSVTVDNPTTRQVASYWQKLIDQDLATKYDLLGEEYNKALNDDKLWGMIGAAWSAKYIEAVSPKTSGDWRVAPLPQWTPGRPADGNWGGATLVVFKGAKHPAEAARFALWFTSNAGAQRLNVRNGGIFPATARAVRRVPALQKGTPFLGGQKQWSLFDTLNGIVRPSWAWGPTHLQVQRDLQDGLQAALSGKKKLLDVIKTLQAKTAAAMKAQAIPVRE